MRTLIFGSGSIGCLLGARLQASGSAVTFHDDEATLVALRKSGLTLLAREGSDIHLPGPEIDTEPARLGPGDVVILAVKAHQIQGALDDIEHVLRGGATLLTLQNGLPWWYFHGSGGRHAGHPLRIVDPKPLRLPPDVTVEAVGDREAKGLELTSEKWVIAPVARQIERISGSHFDPGLVRDFVKERSDEYGPNLGSRIVAWSQKIPVTIVGSLYELLLVLMLTAFIVTDRKGIAAFFESLPPPHLRPGYRSLMGYVDRGLSGVIRGQLVICAVNGLLTWLGLLILGVPYATLLGFVAGVFSLIPVFGTIASSIPIVLVALATGGLNAAVLALGWISLIHLLEANLLNPLIMGTSAEMHPVLIIFALLAGEHAFGIWGALLAVPTASVILSAFRWFREQVLKEPPSAHEGHGAWMRKLLAKWKGRAGSAAPGGST